MADRQQLTRALRDFERGRKVSHLNPQERKNLIEGIKQRIDEVDAKIKALASSHL